MLWDPTGRTLFSSDCFGALVPSPVASAHEMSAKDLRDGMMTFIAVDSPWVRSVKPEALAQAARSVAELEPHTVLSTHLAPARGMLQSLTENLLLAPDGPVVAMPDQEAFREMLSAAA